MRTLENFTKSVKRKIERLLKKMFGFNDVKTALEHQKWLKNKIERMCDKRIDELCINDLKAWKNGCYYYAKYRTLKKITGVYLDIVSLDFSSDELEVYKNECEQGE